MAVMIEKAKEELEMLETYYPHRFDYLKLELKSFISFLQSELVDPLPTSSSAPTQASTTSQQRKRVYSKKRKMEDVPKWKNEEQKSENEFYAKKVMRMQRDRVDVALEKAEACLRKIKDLKCSLVC